MDPRMHQRVEPEKSSRDMVVQWLKEASMSTNDTVKVQNLHKAQEILLNREPVLLNSHLDDILQFAIDRSAEVRITVAGFVEEAGVKKPDIIPRFVLVLLRLINDTTPAVIKRALRSSGKILRATLRWAASAPIVIADMENAWSQISNLKVQIIDMIQNDNDGIRTQALKFLEGVVLIQTYPDPDSPKKPDDFSLEDIPLTLKMARRRILEEEANRVMDLLLKFFGSPHISSVNLITCMGSLSLIAKMRPQFIPNIIQAMQRLQSVLPPTLSESQCTSVKKQLKFTLFSLLKHPASIEYAQPLARQLTQLGCKENEILKYFPKPEEIRKLNKRKLEKSAAALAAKKARVESIVPIDDPEPVPSPVPPPEIPELVELLENFIAERLSVEIATELVMDSMAWVPEIMTSVFQREYQPTGSSGTTRQRQVIAKLLAEQIKQAKTKKSKSNSKELDDTLMEDLIKNPTITVAEVERERKREEDREKEQQAKASLEAHEKSLANARTKLKLLKLSEVAKPMLKDTRDRMLLTAVNRILATEKSSTLFGGVANIRMKILTTLGATFNPFVKEAVLRHITEDVGTRLELALCWLYEEYALLQELQRKTILSSNPKEAPHEAYNFLFCALVTAVDAISRDKDRDDLLAKLYLEAPLITEDAVEALKMISSDDARGFAPLRLLKDLVVRRPANQLVFLNVLLCHTGHENNMICENAIQQVVQLYDRPELCKLIEEYSVMYLSFLRLSNPPEIIFGQDRGRPQIKHKWTKATTRACLGLYLALLTEHENLIHELGRIYATMSAAMKRIVLKLIDSTVRALGMDSPQLLELIGNCPTGAETLIFRILQIFTEKNTPSAELVSKVREMYQTRVSDVRFLIPVLNGLTKEQVIAELPKLIKLDPTVVKDVFNRLLGTHDNDSGGPYCTSPVTPKELLIALHKIKPKKADLKAVIKATSMCLTKKQVYTQEIVKTVIWPLMDTTPLPTLTMRTVLQSLSLHPHLSGFVISILPRLILKKIWKRPIIWRGFVKVCEITCPESLAILIQLPPTQLIEVLNMAPNIREPLVAHFESFADNQKARISQSIMDIIRGKPPILMLDD